MAAPRFFDRAVRQLARRIVLSSAAVLLGLPLSGGSLRAEPVVLSTLSETPGSWLGIGYGYMGVVQRFTTSDSPGGWLLQSVTFPITRLASGSQFKVQVFSNTISVSSPPFGSTPGTPIGTLDGPDDPSTGLQTYTAGAAGIKLDGNTDYWFVWESLGGPYSLEYNPNAPMTGAWSIPTSGNSFGTRIYSTWSLLDRSYGSTLMAISATPLSAVPEIDPAGLGSVLTLLCGALGLLERRRLAASATTPG